MLGDELIKAWRRGNVGGPTGWMAEGRSEGVREGWEGEGGKLVKLSTRKEG